MQISPYDPSMHDAWNAFVARSKNGTFLFNRGYMDYHADRFIDASLVAREGDAIVALLPANRDGTEVRSHGGLTYGGFVVDDTMTLPLFLTMFNAARVHLAEHGVTDLIYKTVPRIYHRGCADDDLYALFAAQATLERRDVLTVADRDVPVAPQSRRMRTLAKARKSGLVVRDTQDYAAFWEILSANLATRFNLTPVHTVAEIELLAGRFTDEIRLLGTFDGDRMLAGAVLYNTTTVCHVQYNAASPDGKQIGALDLIFDRVAAELTGPRRYLDFGISTERGGAYLNQGLVEYKEGFGARTVIHDGYRVRIGSTT